MKKGTLQFLLPVIIGTVFLCSSGTSLAVVTGPGNILANEEANAADAATLANEAGVFGSIRMGIALSMAQCEGSADCSPSVNEDELKQLIQTLDTRIDVLTLRQEEAVDPEGFDEILALYVNERDQYAHFMEKLGTLSKDIEAVGQEAVEEEKIAPEEESVDEGVVDEAASEEGVDLGKELEFFQDDQDTGEDSIAPEESESDTGPIEENP